MWDILRVSRWHVFVAICIEDREKMTWRINIIIFICRLTCESWLPRLRASGSELGWALRSELDFSVGVVLGATAGSSQEYFIIMLLGLSLRNNFGTWEGDLVGFPLDTLGVLIIGTGEGLLVSWSLGLPLGSPFESTNTRDLFSSFFRSPTGMIFGTSLGNPLGYLLDYIWHKNWCWPWIGSWQILWHYNLVTYLLLRLLGTWHTYWHADGTFTWKWSWNVSWRIPRIAFGLLFGSPLGDLCSESWFIVLELIADNPPGSKVR